MFNSDNHSSYGDYVKMMTKYFNLDNPAPFVSAKSWIMYNRDTNKIMYGKQENLKR